jgi:hypothetical protein
VPPGEPLRAIENPIIVKQKVTMENGEYRTQFIGLIKGIKYKTLVDTSLILFKLNLSNKFYSHLFFVESNSIV